MKSGCMDLRLAVVAVGLSEVLDGLRIPIFCSCSVELFSVSDRLLEIGNEVSYSLLDIRT